MKVGKDLKDKTKNILASNKWYHATTLGGWHNICRLGIQADYNKETSLDLDFGYGFYLSPTQELAESYIERLVKAVLIEKNEPVIVEFNFTPLNWFVDGHNSTVFEYYDDQFANFVFENRTENYNGGNQHNYDIIYGVMSDSVPTELLSKYGAGLITKQMVLDGIKKSTRMKQLSLHDQLLCDIIEPSKAYRFDVDTNSREELSVNEYRAKK